jgi:hypothetical protein
MFDNLTGTVGTLMHEDRLAKATQNLRIMEAEAASKRQRRSAGAAYRAAIAKSLVTLAARIAPTVAVPNPSTPALVQ